MAAEPGAPARVHGGPALDELEALGIARSGVVDFSVNLNPYGPSSLMVEAIRAARIDVYPDSTARQARERLGHALGVTAERIVVGNGAADLLWTLARVLVPAGAPALVVEPTFSEFGAAVRAGRGRLEEWRAQPDDDFANDMTAIAAAARAARVVALYLCSPNNPTGVVTASADIARLATQLPQVTLVVDQAFLSLSEAHADHTLAFPENVVLVRSLTKEHAIPGVRVGYLVAAPDLARRIEAARPAWTTGAAAQAAACASPDAGAFVAESRARMLGDRRALVDGLWAIGLGPVPTVATFCLLPVGQAQPLRRRLLAGHQILVRDCTSFGLPGHIRIGARPAPDRARLRAALAEELR